MKTKPLKSLTVGILCILALASPPGILAADAPKGKPTITLAEQEVIEALLQQDSSTKRYAKHILRDVASAQDLQSGQSEEDLAKELRDAARGRPEPFKEALEDFLKKNKAPVKIVLPTNAPSAVEMASEVEINQMFSTKGSGTQPDGWKVFYKRFPNSGGLLSISRVGLDAKGTVAIVYMGEQRGWLAGGGHIRILKREGGKWVLTNDFIGPMWVS